MKTVLVIEDDKDLNAGIKYSLESKDIRIKQAYSIKEAQQKIDSKLNLILLDINLPDGSGIEYCMQLRRKSNVPIVFITANDTEYDIVKGLELGGDDYITKPFTTMVLRARVMAVLRRYESTEGSLILLDEFRFDFDSMLFFRGEERIHLSKAEQKLLKILVINKGNILSKEQLIDYIWSGEAEFVEENALIVTVRRLRNKLGGVDNSKIKNMYGIGYTWRD